MPQMTLDQAVGLAVSHLQAGRLREAESLCRQVLTHRPRDPLALHTLGLIAARCGRHDAAADLLGRAVAAAPSAPEFQYNLSHSLWALGRREEAVAALRQALALKPDFAAAMSNLGVYLQALGRRDEAAQWLHNVLRIDPRNAGAHLNLGMAAREGSKLDEAVEHLRRAVALDPSYAPAFLTLGSYLRESGRVDEAVAAFRKALAIKPDYRQAHGNLLYALHFHPGYDAAALLEEHRRWAGQFADPLTAAAAPHANVPDPGRRVRVGYVSPNLRNHVVGLYLEPVLAAHDRDAFEIVCYSDAAAEDAVSERIRRSADAWHRTGGLTDEQLAAKVRSDGVDVLVDLNLHMAQSRLLAFARKPAPVQVSYFGYPSTTGMRAIDHVITDVHLNPRGACDAGYTEQLYRLPETHLCYPPGAGDPEPGEPPVLRRGTITFGARNTLAKVNPAVLRVWAKVLDAVPGSRLAVMAIGGREGSASAVRMFAEHGIGAERLVVWPYTPRDEYLRLYHEIDVSLDPFPYCGHTTALDSLWMGIPVVTLPGSTAVSRAGVTFLANVGLPELVAASPEDYVRIAADLARDPQRLSELRRTLRDRMRNSPLCQPQRLARHLEAAYRQMWAGWCEGRAEAGSRGPPQSS
jgi:predicted O-linked N-acetylglucosamine transferase (SPINDLY family)